MTEVLHSSPSSSSPSSSISTPTHIVPRTVTFLDEGFVCGVSQDDNGDIEEAEEEEEEVRKKNNRNTTNQLSLLALLLALFRKSFWMACKTEREELCTTTSSANASASAGASASASAGASASASGAAGSGMEIGYPTNVHHVSHVTFDRFNGFLGLPVEFEPEVPRRPPSASTRVFGVSTESMQLSFDHRGNSIPTILLLLQRRLYAQGGLQAEGIFRINGENSQNEYVRDQLNRGVVPDGIDVHCLAGLIKAWFRELPRGVLDPLSPERVMQCQLEEECVSLVRILPPIEKALLDWAINLMADVVQEEPLNKMNTRNIAMVFAPNMTQMSDPLTALMYAVKVMNFLKTLIERTLRERQDTAREPQRVSQLKPSDEDGHQKPSQPSLENVSESNEVTNHVYVVEEPDSDTAVVEYDSDTVSDTAVVENDSGTVSDTTEVVEQDFDTASDSYHLDNISDEEVSRYSTFAEDSDGSESCETPIQDYIISIMRDCGSSCPNTSMDESTQIRKIRQSSDSNQAKSGGQQLIVQSVVTERKSKEVSKLSRINSITERVEAWR